VALHLPKQLRNGDLEAVGDAPDSLQRWVASSPFDAARVSAVNTCPIGEFLLAKPLPLSQSPDRFAECSLKIWHRPKLGLCRRTVHGLIVTLAPGALDSSVRTPRQEARGMGTEQVVRAEKASTGFAGRDKGWLELTPRALVFRKKDGGPVRFEIPVTDIEGARAKKAFRAGTEILEVVYRDEKGKRQTRSFERTSFGAVTMSLYASRAEPNSFASFERDIAELRQQQREPARQAPAAPPDRVEQLRQLGELRSSGVLTEDEFQAEKARILGS